MMLCGLCWFLGSLFYKKQKSNNEQKTTEMVELPPKPQIEKIDDCDDGWEKV
jgi:hypothetical protein